MKISKSVRNRHAFVRWATTLVIGTIGAVGVLCALTPIQAYAELAPRTASIDALKADFAQIFAQAKVDWAKQNQAAPISAFNVEFIAFRVPPRTDVQTNQVSVQCTPEGSVTLQVDAPPTERASTAYYGLHRLGFLFPHPREQISPLEPQIKNACGQTYEFRPRFKFRGMHLHAMHPSEFMGGFLQNQSAVSDAIVRWHARNFQNVLNIVLLRIPVGTLAQSLKAPLTLAQDLGISVGLAISFAQRQQRSYRLIESFVLSSEPEKYEKFHLDQIATGAQKLTSAIPFDFAQLSMGTSEFTSTNYPETLRWIEAARVAFRARGKSIFVGVHVSSNQTDPEYGNFNFLPQYSAPDVGVWPHTVMFYGLTDTYTPVYGRKNFDDIRDFMLAQRPKRQTWYFPETSYYCAIDLDIPLFLTDYLTARSADMDYAEQAGIEGHVNFTTGHELGYWLMDWTVALLAVQDYRGDAMIGLRLLGEDTSAWRRLMDYQTRTIKDGQLIRLLSSSTLLDEAPVVGHSVHERVLLRDLIRQPALIAQQHAELSLAVSELPALDASIAAIRHPELKIMMEVTFLRYRHALQLRRAMARSANRAQRTFEIALAKDIRSRAYALMQKLTDQYDRYPESKNFIKQPGKNSNPSSYRFGYGWTAAALHYWEREERMIATNNYDAFFMNVFDPVDFIK